MGKRSLQKINLNAYRTRIRKWQNKLKPPYPCPVCHKQRAVYVKKEDNQYHLHCQFGCFDITYPCVSDAFEPIDAYSKLVDDIQNDKEVTIRGK
jgi:transcription elongation factor Elf1